MLFGSVCDILIALIVSYVGFDGGKKARQADVCPRKRRELGKENCLGVAEFRDFRKTERILKKECYIA